MTIASRYTPAGAKQILHDWQQQWQPGASEGDWAKDVTIIIKTFERPLCVVNLIKTLRVHYPTIRALVCDDSKEPLFDDGTEPVQGVTWLTLPFEDGHTLGAGRNHLVKMTQTPYFFLCDDDHTFTEGSRLEPMHGFLQRSGYDIVGGCQGDEDYGTAIFERKNGLCYQHFHRHHGQIEPLVVACDRTSNTFMGRTEAVDRIGWEGRVYAHEHADFFLRASEGGLKIAQMGRTWVGHERQCEPPKGWLGTWFGRWLSHRDGFYHNLRYGGDGQDRSAKATAEDLYQRYVLDKNGVSDIKDVYRRKDRIALEKLLGKPTDPWPM